MTRSVGVTGLGPWRHIRWYCVLGEQGWLSTPIPGVDGRQIGPRDAIQVGLVHQQRISQQGSCARCVGILEELPWF